MGNRSVIKSGTVGDFLKRSNPDSVFFLSKTTIPDAPSTKKRSRLKRAIVLAMEMEQINKKINVSDFPLATRGRRFSDGKL